MKNSKGIDTIIPVDCHYLREEITSVYLVVENNFAAIVDAGAQSAAPYILEALEEAGIPFENVKYIILTHAHLDHSGGTARLLEHCPNAEVVCHPKAARHLVNPERLVQGARHIYGAARFDKIYGEVKGVPKEKIRSVKDNEVIKLGGREFRFLHTAGHANHHICIFDSYSASVFTGDTFGVAYPMLQTGSTPFLYPATPPTELDIEELRGSIDRILKLNPSQVCLAHYGIWEDAAQGAKQLYAALLIIENIFNKAFACDMEGEALNKFCYKEFLAFLKSELKERNLSPPENAWRELNIDIELNSMGIALAAQRARKKALRKQ